MTLLQSMSEKITSSLLKLRRFRTACFLSSQSVSFYERSRDIAHILDNMDVYVLPVMNPDGYKYTWTTVQRPPSTHSYRSLPSSLSCTVLLKGRVDDLFYKLFLLSYLLTFSPHSVIGWPTCLSTYIPGNMAAIEP